jgi:UDP-glucose:(heptosyl)LPS alpha-1,3-glucosyltransferase
VSGLPRATCAPNRRLRIAYIVHDYGRRGGHDRYVAELASRFKRDHDIHIYANTFEEPDPTNLTFHRVPAWRANALTSIVSFNLPATFLLRGRYDVVHSQGLCGLRQTVVTAHICQAAWFEATDRYAPSPGWRKRVFRAIVSRLDHLAYRRRAAEIIIAPSALVRDNLSKYLSVDPDRVRVVYHGTDTEKFHPRNRAIWRGPVRRELGLTDADPVALYVGDLQKGGMAAIRTVAGVSGLRLILVSRSNFDQYRKLAADLGSIDRVAFVPFSHQVERYYATADLFLFPTLYDAFGLVVTEAMAAGLPVVTSRAAGAAELIRHGENGWLTSHPWEPKELMEAVSTLTADHGQRSRLGVAARTTAENFTWEQTATGTMAVYCETEAARRENCRE